MSRRADSVGDANDFFKRGTPTLVVGTAGDDHADRAIKAQAAMIRDLLFPSAKIIDDSAVDVTKGPAAWPANPILYGGPHVNHVLAKLGAALSFRMERGKMTVGDQVFEGDEYRLITLVPARAASKEGLGNPEFLLYAGTGSPGVGEINAVCNGGDSILIADSFGRLLAGSWQKKGDGTIAPTFAQPRARRIAWRTVDRELKSNVPANVPVANLLGKQFRQMPENQTYPLAGILIEAAVDKLGVAKVRQHLYGATASTWEAACKDAGTTPQELESAFQTALGRP